MIWTSSFPELTETSKQTTINTVELYLAFYDRYSGMFLTKTRIKISFQLYHIFLSTYETFLLTMDRR